MNRSSKIKILFDANPMAISEKSGVGYYSTYIVQALAESYPDNLQLVGHYYDFLGRKHPVLPQAPNITYRPTKLFPGRVTNMLRRFGISIPFEWLIKSRGDILLFPNFFTQPSAHRKPVVVTIHDLCFVEHPEFVNTLNLHDLRKYVPQSLKRASLVLAVSEFTKTSLVKTFSVEPSKILVTTVPPLKKESVKPALAAELILKLGLRKPYILFVGNLEPRKNLINLVQAYSKCLQGIRDSYSLVLAGGKGWKNEELLASIARLQDEGTDIVLTGYVSDEQRAALYQQAALVVLPSYYEGFGMPILEAFQYGVPVAASNISVLRESAGNAASYFDPADPADISRVIAAVLADRSLQEKLVSKEPVELSKYSWGVIVKELFAKFQELSYENSD